MIDNHYYCGDENQPPKRQKGDPNQPILDLISSSLCCISGLSYRDLSSLEMTCSLGKETFSLHPYWARIAQVASELTPDHYYSTSDKSLVASSLDKLRRTQNDIQKQLKRIYKALNPDSMEWPIESVVMDHLARRRFDLAFQDVECVTIQSESEYLFATIAKEAFTNGEHEIAQRALSKSLTKKKKPIPSIYELKTFRRQTEALFLSGEIETSINQLKELPYRNSRAVGLASIALQQEDDELFSEALSDAFAIITSDTKIKLLASMGLLSYQHNRNDLAQKCFNHALDALKAIESEPDRVEPGYHLTKKMIRAGCFFAAEDTILLIEDPVFKDLLYRKLAIRCLKHKNYSQYKHTLSLIQNPTEQANCLARAGLISKKLRKLSTQQAEHELSKSSLLGFDTIRARLDLSKNNYLSGNTLIALDRIREIWNQLSMLCPSSDRMKRMEGTLVTLSSCGMLEEAVKLAASITHKKTRTKALIALHHIANQTILKLS